MGLVLTRQWGDVMVNKLGIILVVLSNGKSNHNQMMTVINKYVITN